MAQLKQIVDYCDELLQVQDFRDYCPNGLQVEGDSEVNKIICGVTACQQLIDAAIERKADAILVHHGYFWKGEDASIIGIKKNRIAALLQNNISLLAYHLPLDAHAEYGNNVELARKLEINVTACIDSGPAKGLLWYGELPNAMTADQLSDHIAQRIDRSPLHLPASSNKKIQTIGWCTGGAQGYIQQAAELELDAYISGEVSEQTYHLAHELDIHYFGAGHHATESYGVQALGEHLSGRFHLACQFVDVPNPV